MDAPQFDRMTRLWGAALSRRHLGALLATLGASVGLGFGTQTRARKGRKKKKKKCKPRCSGGARCLKGKCVCPSGSKRCNGACIPTDDCCLDAECANGGICAGGACACGTGEEECDGLCTLSERICEEFCCPVDVECFSDGCVCEEFLCRCDDELTYCSTPDFTQCCLPEDDCDPLAACTTETCAAGNDVCAFGAAFCVGGELCLCATPADEEGDPFCADFAALEDCPAESVCASNDDCGAGETCANVPCCGDDETEFFGVCLLPCAAARTARAAPADRAGGRRRLARALNLNVSWSQPAKRTPLSHRDLTGGGIRHGHRLRGRHDG